jgi:5-methyltetrahydropteroyltriglutamate--homocysteine methyltransferase
MYVQMVTREFYPTKEDLAEDVVRLLREELIDLAQPGADFVQLLDEPVLSELVFTQGQTRTFMCAALAARKDPAEELEFAVSLINRVVDGVEGVRTGLHICRGNWSQNESTLLRGSYDPLIPYLDRLKVQQLVLEYATVWAGDLVPFQDKELGLGVVNPRTETIESTDQIKRSVDRALKLYPPDKLFLNPDCGFGTFASRPVNISEVAFEKLIVIVQAAKALRDSL